jgi:hypothetical protein
MRANKANLLATYLMKTPLLFGSRPPQSTSREKGSELESHFTRETISRESHKNNPKDKKYNKDDFLFSAFRTANPVFLSSKSA